MNGVREFIRRFTARSRGGCLGRQRSATMSLRLRSTVPAVAATLALMAAPATRALAGAGTGVGAGIGAHFSAGQASTMAVIGDIPYESHKLAVFPPTSRVPRRQPFTPGDAIYSTYGVNGAARPTSRTRDRREQECEGLPEAFPRAATADVFSWVKVPFTVT